MKDQKEKFKKQFHLPLLSKRIKYLGINLRNNIPKETKDMYSENYKMLMKERLEHFLTLYTEILRGLSIYM